MKKTHADRGRELLEAWKRCGGDRSRIQGLMAAYMAKGYGERQNARVTLIEMLSDIGHVLGGEDGFNKAIVEARSGSSQEEPAATSPSLFIKGIMDHLREIGEDPNQALLTASSLLESDLYGQDDAVGFSR